MRVAVAAAFLAVVWCAQAQVTADEITNLPGVVSTIRYENGSHIGLEECASLLQAVRWLHERHRLWPDVLLVCREPRQPRERPCCSLAERRCVRVVLFPSSLSDALGQAQVAAASEDCYQRTDLGSLTVTCSFKPILTLGIALQTFFTWKVLPGGSDPSPCLFQWLSWTYTRG